MNLTVFGATGGVGREVVTQGLDAGHDVRACSTPLTQAPHGRGRNPKRRAL